MIILNQADLYNEIEKKLSNFGLTPCRVGYKYILESVVYIFNVSGSVSITKEIYPYIAKMFDTSINAVERAMRTAIDCACKMNDKFPLYSFDGITHIHFSNKEFIIKTVNAVKKNKEIVNNDEY